MTLIVTCMTEHHIVQVADRRLVDATGTLYDDEACKVTILGGRGVVAFSGLAFLGVPPMSATDFWITDTLTGTTDPTDAQRVLREAATSRFARLPYRPEDRRQAFVVAGWDLLDPERASPVVYTVSNSLQPDGRWLPKAGASFIVHTARHHRKEPEIRTAGLKLGKAAKLLATRAREYPSRHSVEALATSLATTVREIATTEPSVGAGLLVTVLPRAAIGQPGFETPPSGRHSLASGLGFDPDQPTAIYLPSGDSTGTSYFPNLVNPDMSLMGMVVYDRALTAEEVKADYERGRRRLVGIEESGDAS